MARVDYSELVDALQQGDHSKANELLSEVMPKLVDYLRVVMSASERDARECSQQAFLDVFERLQEGRIEDQKYILSYLMTTARNNYMRYKKVEHRFVTDETGQLNQVSPAEQVTNLLDKERMRILEECLNELHSKSKSLITYMMNHPDKTMEEIGKRFGLSHANVRTKKSRLTNKLHHCYKRKSAL